MTNCGWRCVDGEDVGAPEWSWNMINAADENCPEHGDKVPAPGVRSRRYKVTLTYMKFNDYPDTRVQLTMVIENQDSAPFAMIRASQSAFEQFPECIDWNLLEIATEDLDLDSEIA